MSTVATFNDAWRRRKSAAFDLTVNSTAGGATEIELWGRTRSVYNNANLSIYSAQPCNAACPFCVEELRPASRGVSLASQKMREVDDGRYFRRLEETLVALAPLGLSVSITGGEPSLDPRLPQTLQLVSRLAPRKRTMTTNGSGLLQVLRGRPVIEWVAEAALDHLNVSVAHPDPQTSGRLMRLQPPLSHRQLALIVERSRKAGTRVRLSCILLRGTVETLDDILGYLDFAATVGVDNVIFRQAMKTDPTTHARNYVVAYSDERRVLLEPLLDEISARPDFEPVRQVMGYYYYVEVWRYRGLDVVFEEADLAQLEIAKQRDPQTIHELVFHPSATLNGTWQPWDGLLGPPSDRVL